MFGSHQEPAATDCLRSDGEPLPNLQAGGAVSSSDIARRTSLKQRWTINGDFIALTPTGVPRYAREVTLALDALVAEGHPATLACDIDLVAPREPPKDLQLTAIPVRVVPEFKPRIPQFWVQAQLPFHVGGGLLSFCNLAPIALKRHIVCIHDMHTRLMPESYGRGFRWAHRMILPIVGRRAARITTVSELSRSHLVKYGIARGDKITVTYNGSDHALRWSGSRSSLSFLPRRPYVLCLGRQQQKYKNVELVIRLAPMLDRLGLDVWMPGDVDKDFVAQLVTQVPRNLRLVGQIDDDDFKKAFSGALCFLFPSRIEGFGLPAVEAMAAGCPVIASTAPCLPEVCGDAALYAGPDDIEAWIGAVKRILDSPDLRRHLVAAGREQARKYSWRGIALMYLDLMSQIDGELEFAVKGRNSAPKRTDCGAKWVEE